MHNASYMTKENFEACAIGTKMVTIKERSLAWEHLGKGSDGIRT